MICGCRQMKMEKSLSTFDLPRSQEENGTLFKNKKGKSIFYSPGDLVQPLGSIETLMAVGGIYGTLNTVQAIWLKSKNQLKEQHMIDALRILSRQIPHLQFCLSRRGWRLYFQRIKEFNVDFEVRNEDVMDVYQEMLETKYNVWTGPLWKVKMVIPNINNNVNDQDDFSAALIFGVQHCLTDGTTNMRLCREIVNILNKITSGKAVIPKIVPLAPIIDSTIEGMPPIVFLTKYFCKKFLATMIKNFHHKSSFSGSLPVPQTTDTQTKVLFDELTKSETDILLKMCKSAEITVHSCIVTITNFALLKVAQSNAVNSLGLAKINVTHCVNMRRYLSQEYSDSSGCHISFLEDQSKMSLQDSVDFWSQAKKIHDSIKKHLEVGKDQVRIIPILRLASMIFPANVYLTRRGYKNKTDCHYITTNMGNLKKLLPAPEKDDTIEITNVLRSVSSHLAGNPFLLGFHTFRDRFMWSIDYYTNKMTDETAQEFFAIMGQFLRNLIKHDSLYEPPKY